MRTPCGVTSTGTRKCATTRTTRDVGSSSVAYISRRRTKGMTTSNPDLQGVYVMVRSALRTASPEEVRSVVNQAIDDNHRRRWEQRDRLRVHHRGTDYELDRSRREAA